MVDCLESGSTIQPLRVVCLPQGASSLSKMANRINVANQTAEVRFLSPTVTWWQSVAAYSNDIIARLYLPGSTLVTAYLQLCNITTAVCRFENRVLGFSMNMDRWI